MGCGGSKRVLSARMMSPWPPAGLNFSGLGKDDANERRQCFFNQPKEAVATFGVNYRRGSLSIKRLFP